MKQRAQSIGSGRGTRIHRSPYLTGTVSEDLRVAAGATLDLRRFVNDGADGPKHAPIVAPSTRTDATRAACVRPLSHSAEAVMGLQLPERRPPGPRRRAGWHPGIQPPPHNQCRRRPPPPRRPCTAHPRPAQRHPAFVPQSTQIALDRQWPAIVLPGEAAVRLGRHGDDGTGSIAPQRARPGSE